MANEKVTSLDVAKLAGVSQSAVSRVYTPGASASAKTVEKVRRAATQLGYRPNTLARSLITGKSYSIGLVFSYLENQFYPGVLEKLCAALQEQGYHVLLFMVPQHTANIDDVLHKILDHQVDGIIMASVTISSDHAAQCQAAGVPVVLFNRAQDDPRVAAVTSDNIAGGRQLAEFLIAGGHRSFGYIAGQEGASTQRDREAGFREGLQSAGFDLTFREVGNYDMEQAKSAARRMFSEPDSLPDAVFVANDSMAFAVMDVLRQERGLSVPGDISVVGYDDAIPAAWPAYDLTTVRQPAAAMVAEAVRAVLSAIDHPAAAPVRTEIKGQLIVRGSARMPVEGAPK